LTIKAITFDFWSTLYKGGNVDQNQRLLDLQQAVERGSGASFDLSQIKAAVIGARNMWRQTWMEEHRTIAADEWLSLMLNQLGVSLSPVDLREIQTFMEHGVLRNLPVLVPEARAVLADLSTRYRLAIISDTGITPGSVLRQLLEEDEIISYFTHLTFSDELGRSKPHPNTFLSTLDALQVTPQQAIHVGDLLRTDIAGAQAVGMRAVQYTGITQDEWIAVSDVSAANIVPDAVIENHTELAPLLRQWNGTEPKFNS
jgi:putative hydrolase of the HAD superfamily